MKPIEFPEQNVVWAKNQLPYLPLPAYTDKNYTISCWKLSWRDRFVLLVRGKVWLSLRNNGQPLQPSRVDVDYPFLKETWGGPPFEAGV